MPDLAIGPEAARATCSSRSLRALQHPYRASASCSSFAEAGTAASPYPAPLLMGLATHLDNAGKMPLTDFCNRHFRHEHPIVDRPTPEPAALAAAATASSRHAQSRLGPSTQGEHGVGPPFGNPAPGRTTLDGAAPASAWLNHLPPAHFGGGHGPARRQGHLGSALSAAPEADDQTSDALCRPPRFPRAFRRASAEDQEPLPPPCVNRSGFPGPRAPFIDMCAAHIRRQHPPPISRLCRRDPASGARSPSRCSRTEWLDPLRLRWLFARVSRGPRAACRLLQSKRSLSTAA
jgi:hypothetical protein